MSEYICNTPSCAISLSKASFPVSMNCPVCQLALTELIEKPLLSEEDELLISNLPYVIAYPLKRTLLEKHPWTKINLLKDTFLNYLKYIGLIAASEFFNSPLKDKKMVSLFQQALAEPSFGSWNQYIRETLSYLKENNHSFFCSDLLSYYDLIESGKKRKLFKGEIEIIDANGDIQIKKQEATAIGMLINFRNRYLGHGLTLDESDAINHWEMYFPIFRELLVQLKFSAEYPMFKFEHGETYLLNSAEISLVEKGIQTSSRVWIENPEGNSMDILPFFVVPGEVSIGKEEKEQLLTYESYTGKTIKFFSPEGTEKQTSGKVLEKLNLLLRDKQKETPFAPETFTKDEFLKRITEENKLLIDTLISEKKILPGIYQHREEMEIKLREWIGARANIFFIVAEAGSGKTNLLVEIQKQYTERDLQSLLIRAGRMGKQTLKEQIAYLLNIDLQPGFAKYRSIAGTQAEPTFILIDGLNEANNAEEIWHEIIELSKVFEPGSLKFVVTNRANTKSELSRYSVTENDCNLLYCENKDNETDLGTYSFWLTPLDMKEMKGAWENYATKDKAKFKPQFNFDDIAEFDRGLYNQINNPLILRLFLEIYNGKSLPKKGVKHLNIWQDWLKTFSEAEQTFFKLLANEIWQKGENELLLDDLLQHETLKPYFTSDIINSPYNRLKYTGWISRYVKDLSGCIGFTVEGSLLYLLALQLDEQKPAIDLKSIQKILNNGSKLKKSSIKTFLCEQAFKGDLNFVCDLIDAGKENIDVSINALLLYLKTYGVNATIEKVLENTSENDWRALKKIVEQLEQLQLHVLRKEFLKTLMPKNRFTSIDSILLGLEAINILPKIDAENYLNKIDLNKYNFLLNSDILDELGYCETRFGNYEKSKEYHEKCLSIRLKVLAKHNLKIATSYNNIGVAWLNIGNYTKALEYFEQCLEIRLKNFGEERESVAKIYGNIGVVWEKKGNYEKSIEFHQKCLAIELKVLGEEHTGVATSYNNLGVSFGRNGNYDKAIEFSEKCVKIRFKILGSEHSDLAVAYNNAGVAWSEKGNFEKTIDYYEKSLKISVLALGYDHSNVATMYNNIGNAWENKGDFLKALKNHKKCLSIRLRVLGKHHPDIAISYLCIGTTLNRLGNWDKALENFEKCLEISLKSLGNSHPFVATAFNNIGNTFHQKGDFEEALKNYEKSLEIRVNSLNEFHPDLAISYNNIGKIWQSKGDFNISLEYFEKCLQLQIKIFGNEHTNVANVYYHIGFSWFKKGNMDNALNYFEKCLAIEIKKLGLKNDSVAMTYNVLGTIWEMKGNYLNAIHYFEKFLEIKENTIGFDTDKVSNTCFIIGKCKYKLDDFISAIHFFKKGFNISKKGGFPFQIGKCYEALQNKELALEYFIQSAELRKIDPEIGIKSEATIDTVKNVLRLAIELERLELVPEWMKNLEL
jgi:tetratricopeptide (TPR) repeat protein